MATEIKYYHTDTGKNIAEILPGSDLIASPDDVLDFIRESNRTGVISFVGSLDEAMSKLSHQLPF